MQMVPKAALTGAATLLVVLWMSGPPAHACTCVPPGGGFVGAANGRLPANAVGVAWFPGYVRNDQHLEGRFSVELFEGGEFQDLPVKVTALEEFPTVFSVLRTNLFLIAPKGDGLKPGATYRFTVDRAGRYGQLHKQVLVTIDRETLSNNTAFTLDVAPVTNEMTALAAAVFCSDTLNVSQVRVRGRLSRHARPWREQLLYRTIVAGELWRPSRSMCEKIVPGRSWESIGHDRIVAACGGLGHDLYIHPILKPGRRSVMMQAFLPGTDVVLETAVKSVDLSCP